MRVQLPSVGKDDLNTGMYSKSDNVLQMSGSRTMGLVQLRFKTMEMVFQERITRPLASLP